MIISIIILIISFCLDGILTNFLPYSVGDLSLFTPLTTIVALVIIYPFFYREDKKYYILGVITGFIYDLFYTNLWFLNGILFLLVSFLVTKLYKLVGSNFFKILFQIFIIIVIYESSYALLILIFNLTPMSLSRLFYKISHSLLFNLIYGEVLYLIIKILPKKWKKMRIN